MRGVPVKLSSPAESALQIWDSSMRLLNAIALRHHRSALAAVGGTHCGVRLHVCLKSLGQVPQGHFICKGDPVT